MGGFSRTVSDRIWSLSDERMIALASRELEIIGFIDSSEILPVLRMETTYPAYFGTHGRFSEIRDYVKQHKILLLFGRKGMHRYGNQDHSMLTGNTDRTRRCEMNTETEYPQGWEAADESNRMVSVSESNQIGY